mmetsp:Transcript_4735/g.5385  ORF Transcript_4735/g.5385 Transcript_4735/m.5385 type:complete len:574 (-) Transcript_4735:354-2075(-)|eukprot:CAMPEP_0170785736 /NCGR_PEP_ID=MMETSP0733-20121128/17129_1 /TAXON_ID=186038 /ORGANISM="Fragilariopsis kerguelensis, Strain L26-C5" /LENGTH=573 /DNA_ID=CAMNT_0011131337 /DNA_START=44 /DNA_END=1765 /DNA_ORIENTATION=-
MQLTKSLTIKRNSKKKSGYSVSEEDGVYYLKNAPSRARINPGDRVVGINGIPFDEFLDEDDANDLIESIRIVVVPKDNLSEYDGIQQDDDSDDKEQEEEEDYEEYDRHSKMPQSNYSTALVAKNMTDEIEVDKELLISNCKHCGHDNVDLVVDEDGDLVCEECGHVIEKPPSDNDIIHSCRNCYHKNRNLEKDEDGDLVCQECGHVIPVENAIVAFDSTNVTCTHCKHSNKNLEPDEDDDLVCQECGYVIEPPEDAPETEIIHTCMHCNHGNKNLQKDDEGDLVCQECGQVLPEDAIALTENVINSKQIIYECPDCSHRMVNPEPDEEGDRVCEECGCILPEKIKYECESCRHENIDPEPNEDSDYTCENCGSSLDVKEKEKKTGAEKLKEINDDSSDAAGDGQQFDDNGRPTTNPDGKKLTPADMFSPGDVITVTVGKSNAKQDPGLKVEDRNGKYYVRKVPSGGLFAKTPVIAGDKILELNGTDSHEFKNVNELKKILKDETRITVLVLRTDPECSESSASSVDYDELKAIKPKGFAKGVVGEKEDDIDDDDTAPYDGKDCGCIWCPTCNE